jgi:hypothetical protein
MDKNIKEILFDDNYYASPYNKDQDCLLSVLMCVRMTRGIGGPTDILTFLSSLFQKWTPLSQSKTEFLIKFDLDDETAIKKLFLEGRINKMIREFNSPSPPIIRYFIYNRWEGKKTFNYHYQYLFSQRNPKSKFITFATDDSYYVDDLIEKLSPVINQEYKILIRSEMYNNVLGTISTWKEPCELRKWASGDLTDPYPIVSSKIIEICGGMGWQQNIDNWFSLLGVILFKKYNIQIFQTFPVCINRKTEERIGLESPNYSAFNKEMFVDDTTFPQNNYYLKLVETQATSIFLHMKNENLI